MSTPPASTVTRRFSFIGQALTAEGGFRPVVSRTLDGAGKEVAQISGACFLTRYPRESAEKYARRAEVAFYASPLAQACARFVGYIATKPPLRDLPNPAYERMAKDIDGQGSALGVWMQGFAVNAKARGSMLALIDMPKRLSANLAAQLAERNLPYWTPVLPETLTEWEIGDDGKFNFCEFPGMFKPDDGSAAVECFWRFDRKGWSATKQDEKKTPLGQGEHALGECPVLIFTEAGAFPSFGPFASIADLSRRLFNLDSELDEILRSQTFSLLTMQVPDDTNAAQKLAAAQAAGETISTQNLIVHSGSTPAFIAPPDGPARVYLDRIDKIRDQIKEVGLDVASINQQESGVAMQARFQVINGQLAYFAERLEDFERRCWDVSRRWLGLAAEPSVEWPRDFNIADVLQELQVLTEMQATGMPQEVIAEQRRKIVGAQFVSSEPEAIDTMIAAIDEDEKAADATLPDGTTPPPLDPNAEVRAGLLRLVGGGNGA